MSKQYEKKTAFVCLNRKTSYAEFNALSHAFAGHLQSLAGLKPGDRVAVMMPNLTQYMVAMLGILRAGMIVVNVNPLYTAPELSHQLADSGAKAVVIIENFAKTLEDALEGTVVRHIVTTKASDMLGFFKRHAGGVVLRRSEKVVPVVNLPGHVNCREAIKRGKANGFTEQPLHNTDIAFLQYAGGTAGVSKGAVLTDRNILANVEQTGTWVS